MKEGKIRKSKVFSLDQTYKRIKRRTLRNFTCSKQLKFFKNFRLYSHYSQIVSFSSKKIHFWKIQAFLNSPKLITFPNIQSKIFEIKVI